MLHYTSVFFGVAIVSAVLSFFGVSGFLGMSAGAAEIAKVLFFVFLGLTFISWIKTLV